MNNNCSNMFTNNCCNAKICCSHRSNCCRNNFVSIPGPTGPAGESSTVNVGTTTTSNPGTNASVTNSGTANNAVLNFVIPRGKPGNDGLAATINIGTTTTLPAGSEATVTNSGTSTNAILNFGIPTGSTTLNEINSGSFISRNFQTFTNDNSVIQLPITLNNKNISINNSIINISKSSRYMINYGLKSTTIGNTFGLYVNGINNTNTNIETTISDLSPSASIILELNQNDSLTLGAVNASINQPLTLQTNTINAYITIISLD